MDNKTFEEFGVLPFLNKEKDIIASSIVMSERILALLRGGVKEENDTCIKEECLLDTLKNNTEDLIRLERNLKEITQRLIGGEC